MSAAMLRRMSLGAATVAGSGFVVTSGAAGTDGVGCRPALLHVVSPDGAAESSAGDRPEVDALLLGDATCER